MNNENEWSTNLCGCFEDWGSCCYGFWCTPCLFGSNAKRIDGDNCCCMCLLYIVLGHCYACWVPHYMKRQKLREKYNLKANPSCGDCPTTLCCGPCALCQEARELDMQESKPRVHFHANGSPPVVAQPGVASTEESSVNLKM